MTKYLLNHVPATIGILAREGIERLLDDEDLFDQIVSESRKINSSEVMRILAWAKCG